MRRSWRRIIAMFWFVMAVLTGLDGVLLGGQAERSPSCTGTLSRFMRR